MKKQRFLELDALRGIAALAVVFYHYFYRYNNIYGHSEIAVDWASWGAYGVQLFFIISGFVIFMTINNVKKPKDFLISRFSRLYPAFWVCALTTYCVMHFFPLQGRETELAYAILNLLMFHQYFDVPHIDGVYWTLTVELTFYCWVFIFYSCKQINNLVFFLAGSTFLYILKNQQIISPPEITSLILLIDYVPFFLIGLCCFKVFQKGCQKRYYLSLFLAIFAILSGTNYLTLSAVYLILILSFILAINNKLTFLKFKPLVWLGSISYSLYLLHQNIGYIIINFAIDHEIPPLIGIAVAVFVSLSLAHLSFKYVERPALRTIKTRFS